MDNTKITDKMYTFRMKRHGVFSRTVLIDGQSSYILLPKWFPGMGILGRKYLFHGTSNTHTLWLEQEGAAFINWHCTISENERIAGRAGTRGIFDNRGFVEIENLCKFDMPLGHGLRSNFDTMTSNGEQLKISLARFGNWEVLLPSELNDYRVLAGLALIYAVYMSRD